MVLLMVAGLILSNGLGCSSKECTDEARQGLVVTVGDAETGEPLCDATVTAKSGDRVEQLLPAWSGPECDGVYSAFENAGTWDVEITADGYKVQSLTDVLVESEEECGHSIRKAVSVELQPS